jgi:predicted ABC-type ATPase
MFGLEFFFKGCYSHQYIPEETIRRRYFAGLKNLVNHYLPLVDNAVILDNSIAGINKIILSKDAKNNVIIRNPNIWKEINEKANSAET